MSGLESFPEIVIGIAGPIGVDMDGITESIEAALDDVNYKSRTIKLTSAMLGHEIASRFDEGTDFCSQMDFKINYADALCEENNDLAFLAKVAVKAIVEIRKAEAGGQNAPSASVAYIVRQFKRPEEIKLMRRIYGKHFVLVSAYGSAQDRKAILEGKQKKSSPTKSLPSESSAKVDKLMEKDASEAHKFGGQQLRDTFHLADVFIDGISKPEMNRKLSRFFRAFFGLNTAAPSKDEYGMYAAKSASLRSCDLSRQIGAAIFTTDGEIISQGCNEVPKAFGGTYWDGEEPDYRDIRMGFDPNDEQKYEVVRDLIERLWDDEYLSDKAVSAGSISELINRLTAKAKIIGDTDGALVGSSVLDLTEFGRVVHAEMSAICDAARLGRSVKGSTLYSTTFPCHNCTKHILASGVRRVVYMEPYPKSKAKELHKNEISIELESDNAVSFVPFIGISPFRYRDIFLKDRKRKDKQGHAKTWYAESGEREPMLDAMYNSYLELENEVFAKMLGDFESDQTEVLS